MQARTGSRRLQEGAHAVKLFYEQLGGDAGVRLEWEGPGRPWQTIPSTAYRAPGGLRGLRGVYSQGSRACGLARAQGRQALRALGVRYVVTGYQGNDCLEQSLALPQIYRGEGVLIWEVPAAD